MGRRAWVGILLLIAVMGIGCSPSPTPPPTRGVTREAAAAAYTAVLDPWTAEHADSINAAAGAADLDPALVSTYARTVAEAYADLAAGLASIEVPEPVAPALVAEVDAVDSVIALARSLATDPPNTATSTQLNAALSRVAQTSATVEAMLGITM